MGKRNLPRLINPAVRFLLGLGLILVGSLAIFYLVMRPPTSDLNLMALLLAGTAGISALVGFTAYRAGWLERSPGLGWTLVGSYLLAGLLTFLNVWLTARLMFASPHDLLLATILLVFATSIAVALGYFLTSAVTDRVTSLQHAAQAIASGDLAARAEVRGSDEVAQLAGTFNEMADQLQRAQHKQEELDRLRTELIAWVSHDLQTPLTSIRAMVEALADGMVEDAETASRYLKTTEREISALSLLIDDLFQVAQLDAGGLKLDLRENSLADLVSDTLESFNELAAQRGVSLRGGVPAEVDPVRMDAARIGRVLDNLVGNALRHTPAGGEVEVQGNRQGEHVEVSVRDSGDGIPHEDLPHIFDRFYRGEKSRSRLTGGAGLGLAIAKGIVEAHGGSIHVNSQPGKGTSFIIRL